MFEHQTVMSDVNKAFALKEYNLAIKHLLIPLSPNEERHIDVCLITCILFICFENMQGHYATGGSHIRSGAKLLRETMYDKRNEILENQGLGSKFHINSYAPPEILGRIFGGLDSQTILVVENDKFKLQENLLSGATFEDIPLSFSSIEEAKNFFEYGRCLFMNSHGGQLAMDHVTVNSLAAFEGSEAHINRAATLLSKFSLALQNFSESKGQFLTQKEDIAISVLQLHMRNAFASLYILPPTFPSQWDKAMPQMEEILVLGEKIISLTSLDHQRAQTTFCFDVGIIIPLFTVATQCQDPLMRRRAIFLLRSTSRQEGLWNSLLIAKAAERILEIEESMLEETNACTNCPDLARPASVKPFFELDAKGGRLRYLKRGQGADEYLNVVEEVFHY